MCNARVIPSPEAWNRVARAGVIASVAILYLVGCQEKTVESDATEFLRGTLIPLGPVRLIVADAEIRSSDQHETFHAAWRFRGVTLPTQNRWLVILLQTSGLDSYRKMERFLGTFRGKLALVDGSGRRYSAMPLMDADTYLFFRRTPAARYAAELANLPADALPGLRASAAPDDLQALRSYMDINVNMMTLIMHEDHRLPNPPVPDRYVAMVSVLPESSGFRLMIDNPQPGEGQPRTAMVRLGF